VIIFGPKFGSYKLTHFLLFLRWGVGEVKIIENWGSQNVPKRDFCYIVVSTIFGPSGPPPDPPKSDIFDPPIGAKAQPICGEWVFQ
jgi:hypothetical protein